MEPAALATAREGVLHQSLPWLVTLLDWAAAAIDLAAIALLLLGAARFILGVALSEVRRRGRARARETNSERAQLGLYILAGLELLIVSDIIYTSISLALADLLFLGLLVVIRSLISFFLDRELAQIRRELGQEPPGDPAPAPAAGVDPPGGRG